MTARGSLCTAPSALLAAAPVAAGRAHPLPPTRELWSGQAVTLPCVAIHVAPVAGDQLLEWDTASRQGLLVGDQFVGVGYGAARDRRSRGGWHSTTPGCSREPAGLQLASLVYTI